MTATKKRPQRQRREPGSQPASQAGQEARGAPASKPIPMPEWRWLTFPVYVAFSLGGFIGLYLGLLVQGTDNTVFTYTTFIVFATLLGFGLSRITTRWLVNRRVIRPKARPR